MHLSKVIIPIDVYVEFQIFVKNHSQVETKLHKLYDDYRIKGEWFKLDDKQILEIKNYLLSLEVK